MPNDYFNFKHFTIQQGRSSFRVTTDAVILGSAADVTGIRSVLDIGAGTGIIALMLAQRSDTAITALEPDPGSYSDLELNVAESPWKERIRIYKTRLQNFTPEGKFDLIISNPPFFSNSLRNPDMVKAGARHKDLLTNDDLLSGVDRMIEYEGRFQVIAPKTEGNILISEALKHELFCNEVIKIRPMPYAEINRLVLTFGRKKLTLKESKLTISTGDRHRYTQDYINLTKEFYLKF